MKSHLENAAKTHDMRVDEILKNPERFKIGTREERNLILDELKLAGADKARKGSYVSKEELKPESPSQKGFCGHEFALDSDFLRQSLERWLIKDNLNFYSLVITKPFPIELDSRLFTGKVQDEDILEQLSSGFLYHAALSQMSGSAKKIFIDKVVEIAEEIQLSLDSKSGVVRNVISISTVSLV